MSYRSRVAESMFLTPVQKIILGQLGNYPMSVRQLIDTLVSDPYNISFGEVVEATQHLQRRNIVVISSIIALPAKMDMEVLLTFTHDWVIKF